jgi:hypothetical protein
MSREFRFMVACCNSLFDPAMARALPTQVGEIDPSSLIALAQRHRVEGLAWSALHGAGADLNVPALNPLAAAARDISQQGLRAAAECLRLQSAFGAAGLDLLFLKGLTVGHLAYGNAFVKTSWDIDILVAQGDVGEAADLLEGLNYRCLLPGGKQSEVERWHGPNKESVWQSGDGLHHVELHSRLTDSPRLIPTIGMNSPRQLVPILPGLALPTLATEELFAYLCVHGATSAWFRLKWVADFAGLLCGQDEVDIDSLFRRSQELGAARAAAQALLVTDALFGLPLSTRLRAELERSNANRTLAAAALRQLAAVRSATERRLGTMSIHLTQLLLKPGLSFGWHELRRQAGLAISNRRSS